MNLNKQTLRPTAVTIAIAICLMLILQGLFVYAGEQQAIDEPNGPGAPRAIMGLIMWPNGTKASSTDFTISLTNNRTGDNVVMTAVNGAYNTDISSFSPSYLSTDTIYVNCTYTNMWAHNDTLASGVLPFSMCYLQLVELSLGPELVVSEIGSSITGFGGRVTFDIPSGALDTDTIIFGTEGRTPKPGSLSSIKLGPDGTTFNPAATLTWSYAGLNLGDLNPQLLSIYTYVEIGLPAPFGQIEIPGGYWEEIPSFVDTDAQLVIAEVTHFSNFSMGSASLLGFQTGLEQVYRGTMNAPILDLAITNTDIVSDDTLDYIHVVSSCSDDLDVAGVSLWNDINDNTAIDGGDVQLGVTQPFIGGNTNFSAISENIPANTTLNVLVCLDVALTATVDNYLDVLIPMNAIGLANAGLNAEAVDPVGNTTIIQELTDPHIVYGYVSNAIGILPNVWINITNNRTGITEDLMTDSLGRFEVNLGLMYDGFLDGDEIFLFSNDTFGQTGWNITFVDELNFGERCDVYVANMPLASDETPISGSIIADLQLNITVNIIGSGFPIDTGTIILEVDGMNYTWPDPALSWAVNTLTFDTATAVGSWSMGQIINITLWQANDTFGNPCMNAPYSWSFSIIMNMVAQPMNLTLSNNASAVMLEWDTVQYADSYNVYRTADKFAAWPWAKVGDNITTINWTDAPGTYDDTNTYYYIVKAYNPAGEGGNSSMGTKVRRTFMYNNPALNTNTNWVSLPYNSNYATLIDIVNDIENGTSGPGHARFISGIYIWNAVSQGVVGLTGNNFTGWFGNMAIQPGDAIRLELSSQMSVGQSFGWTIVGTDINSVQNFTYNNPTLNTNTNWISIPYSSNYATLIDIVATIENGTSGPGHAQFISGIYVWNPATQGVVGLTGNNFTGWFGNLAIQPGDAIRLELSSQMTTGQTFSWLLELLTQPIPGAYYYD